MTEQERLNERTERIISAALQVYRALGPGLLESAYEACLVFELIDAGTGRKPFLSPIVAAR
jgi:GxxExxY protein